MGHRITHGLGVNQLHNSLIILTPVDSGLLLHKQKSKNNELSNVNLILMPYSLKYIVGVMQFSPRSLDLLYGFENLMGS